MIDFLFSFLNVDLTIKLFPRIITATVCGMLIGYERESALKPAGLRTHVIVAMASCLMMCVSIYGFVDVHCHNDNLYRFDPSRVAAAVVTGIGFLGAGAIFTKSNSISGLTTAAGIWATSGIGLTIGAGMFGPGIIAALLIFFIQSFSHIHFYSTFVPKTRLILVTIEDNGNFNMFLNHYFNELKLKKVKCSLVSQDSSGLRKYCIKVFTYKRNQFDELLNALKEYDYFISFSIIDAKLN